jgi:hypothetical protein
LSTAPLYENGATTPPVFTGDFDRRELLAGEPRRLLSPEETDLPTRLQDSRFGPPRGDRLSTAPLYENGATTPPVFTGDFDRRELLNKQ